VVRSFVCLFGSFCAVVFPSAGALRRDSTYICFVLCRVVLSCRVIVSFVVSPASAAASTTKIPTTTWRFPCFAFTATTMIQQGLHFLSPSAPHPPLPLSLSLSVSRSLSRSLSLSLSHSSVSFERRRLANILPLIF